MTSLSQQIPEHGIVSLSGLRRLLLLLLLRVDPHANLTHLHGLLLLLLRHARPHHSPSGHAGNDAAATRTGLPYELSASRLLQNLCI